MDYRDERDALRARVESLEGALSTAQADVERMRATEAALEASKREVQRLRAEVERLRPSRDRSPQNGRLWALIGGGSLVMIAAFGAAFLLRAGPREPPKPPVPQFPVTNDVPSPVPEEPQVAEPPRPAPPPKPAKPSRSAHAEWNATVKSIQGSGPPAGASCKILAELSGNGSGAGVSDLEVVCGTRFLYRSTDPFSGVSNNGNNVGESAGKAAGTQRYTLMLQDQGTRSGRAQISLDTAQRSGVIWSDNVPTFRVELAMEAESLPVTGEPLIDPENRVERLSEAVVRTGTASKLEGTPGVTPGAQCTVDVSPVTSGDQNCRVRVRCGGKLLYGDGTSGYNKCTVKEGRIGRLSDPRPSSQDSDPILDMDLSENTVVVSDDVDPPWKLTIALTPAAR